MTGESKNRGSRDYEAALEMRRWLRERRRQDDPPRAARPKGGLWRNADQMSTGNMSSKTKVEGTPGSAERRRARAASDTRGRSARRGHARVCGPLVL